MKILAALLALSCLGLVSCASSKCPFSMKKKDACCSSGETHGATKSCCAH